MSALNTEHIPVSGNRLGIEGIEFVEYATSKPQGFGQVLENMGYRPVARHRSREVVLYRQGDMNLVVRTVDEDSGSGGQHDNGAPEQAVLSAIAFRVQDAGRALQRCTELGAWESPVTAQAMELHIPSILGPGSSRFYFVDRWQDFSIYDVDFKPIPAEQPDPPALAGMHYFGVVQYVDEYRTPDWTAYYQNMFDFHAIPDDERFGIMPNGTLLRSPCGSFLWQLVAPVGFHQTVQSVECLRRVGIGVPDVANAVSELNNRGVEFIDSDQLHPDDRGALTCAVLGGVAFELVHQSSMVR